MPSQSEILYAEALKVHSSQVQGKTLISLLTDPKQLSSKDNPLVSRLESILSLLNRKLSDSVKTEIMHAISHYIKEAARHEGLQDGLIQALEYINENDSTGLHILASHNNTGITKSLFGAEIKLFDELLALCELAPRVRTTVASLLSKRNKQHNTALHLAIHLAYYNELIKKNFTTFRSILKLTASHQDVRHALGKILASETAQKTPSEKLLFMKLLLGGYHVVLKARSALAPRAIALDTDEKEIITAFEAIIDSLKIQMEMDTHFKTQLAIALRCESSNGLTLFAKLIFTANIQDTKEFILSAFNNEEMAKTLIATLSTASIFSLASHHDLSNEQKHLLASCLDEVVTYAVSKNDEELLHAISLTLALNHQRSRFCPEFKTFQKAISCPDLIPVFLRAAIITGKLDMAHRALTMTIPHQTPTITGAQLLLRSGWVTQEEFNQTQTPQALIATVMQKHETILIAVTERLIDIQLALCEPLEHNTLVADLKERIKNRFEYRAFDDEYINTCINTAIRNKLTLIVSNIATQETLRPNKRYSEKAVIGMLHPFGQKSENLSTIIRDGHQLALDFLRSENTPGKISSFAKHCMQKLLSAYVDSFPQKEEIDQLRKNLHELVFSNEKFNDNHAPACSAHNEPDIKMAIESGLLQAIQEKWPNVSANVISFGAAKAEAGERIPKRVMIEELRAAEPQTQSLTLGQARGLIQFGMFQLTAKATAPTSIAESHGDFFTVTAQ